MTNYRKKNSFIAISSDWRVGNMLCSIGQILSQKEDFLSPKFKCYLKLKDCLLNEKLKDKHICRVEILGDIKQSRRVCYTNKIRIIEEINKEQLKNILQKSV